MEQTQFDEKVEQILNTRSVSKAQKLMESESGIWLIAFISFMESALPLPLLTDPFLIASIMLNRSKTALIVTVSTIASVLGGIVAFLSALFFLDVIQRIVSPETSFAIAALSAEYGDSTFLVTLLGAVTPVPYTSAAWAVALIGGNLLIFILASILGRGFRYIVVGFLTYKFGPLAVTYARRSIGITSIIIFILVALYVWHKM